MRKAIIFIVILIFALSAYLGMLIFSPEDSFNPNRIKLSLKGQKNPNWGEKTNYQIIVSNKSKEKLNNLTFKIKTSDKVWTEPKQFSLKSLRKNSEKKLNFQLQAYGNKNQNVKTQAEFQVGNLETTFKKEAQRKLKVKEAPIETTLTKNSDLNTQLKIKNKSSSTLFKIKTTLKNQKNAPDVQFLKSDSSNPKTWVSSKLAPGATSTATIEISEDKPKAQNLSPLFEIFGDKSQLLYKKTRNLSLPSTLRGISLKQRFPNKHQKSFTPGEEFVVRTTLKNNSSSTQEDLNLKISLGGVNYIQTDTIKVNQGGKFNEDKNQITANFFPSLEAGEETHFEFSFQTKDDIEINDQNQGAQISLKTELISAQDKEKVLASNKERLKIETNLEIHTKVSHIAGPHPPAPEKKSTYKITWKLLNSYNNLKNLTVTTILPDKIAWEDSKNEEKINFNKEEKTVSFNIGTLPRGTGWFSPIKEGSFKITITPKKEQEEYFLTGETEARGIDQFRNQQIKKFDPPLTVTKNN